MIKSFFLTFISLLTSFSLNRLDVHQPRTAFKPSYNRSVSISQSFKSHHNQLNIVSICIRNPHRILEPLQFNLYEATPSSQPVRSFNFSSGNIDNQDCTRFQFEPISHSQNKFYFAEIKRLKPNSKKPSSLYVEAYVDNDYLEGTAYRDNQPLNKDLHFKTFYRQPFFQALIQAVHNFSYRIIQDPIFFIFYFFLLGFIVKQFINSKNHD